MSIQMNVLIDALEIYVSDKRRWLASVDNEEYIRCAPDVAVFVAEINEAKADMENAQQYLGFIYSGGRKGGNIQEQPRNGELF